MLLSQHQCVYKNKFLALVVSVSDKFKMSKSFLFLSLVFLCGLASSMVQPPHTMPVTPEPFIKDQQYVAVIDTENGFATMMDDAVWSMEQPTDSPKDSNDNAKMSQSTKTAKVTTTYKSFFIYGASYASQSSGEYTLQDGLVNNYLVYKLINSDEWIFYQRDNGQWYLDFNDPSEEWTGTVMYSETAGPSPHLLEYKNNGFVIKDKSFFVRKFPYFNAEYACLGEIYNNAPVYKSVNSGNEQFSIYRREDGKWYADFNEISEEWTGTIAYTLQSSVVPYDTEWN